MQRNYKRDIIVGLICLAVMAVSAVLATAAYSEELTYKRSVLIHKATVNDIEFVGTNVLYNTEYRQEHAISDDWQFLPNGVIRATTDLNAIPKHGVTGGTHVLQATPTSKGCRIDLIVTLQVDLPFKEGRVAHNVLVRKRAQAEMKRQLDPIFDDEIKRLADGKKVTVIVPAKEKK